MRLALTTTIALYAMTAAASAAAQVTMDRFVPAALASDGFTLSRPTRTGDMQLGALLHLAYAKDPVMWEVKEHTTRDGTYPLVSDQLVVHPTVSLGIADRWLVFARLPINAVVAGDATARTMTTIGYDEGGSLGAFTLGGRYLIYDEGGEPFSLGAQLGVGLPLARVFGATSAFGAESGLTGVGQLLAEYRLGRARFDLNAGVRLRSQVDIDNLKLGNEFVMSLGASYPLFDQQPSRIEAIVEGFGSMLFSSVGGREQSPLEALAGVKLFRQEGISAGVAGSMGLTAGYGSPFYRVVGMLGFSPVPGRTEARHEEEDSDADGVVDSLDRCPHEPDDALDRAGRDGCPKRDVAAPPVEADPDPDHDNVLGAADACPEQPEDKDDFEDTDGCPDPDNDHDGVLDSADKCPREAEDIDNFQDNDGCPDPDNDGDGILDAADQCPLEAEVETGHEDGDGCPKGTVLLDQHSSTLKGLDPIRFETGTAVIHLDSYDTLRKVVSFLSAHPEIEHMSIEGHTDSLGNLTRNQHLSAERAGSVRVFLIREGVNADRLGSSGYGSAVPVADNTTPEGRALNRRVEFRVVPKP